MITGTGPSWLEGETVMKMYLALATSVMMTFAFATSAEETAVENEAPDSVLDFKLPAIDGGELDLGAYEGKVLMLVNVASKCGLTPQYTELTELHEAYREQGFEIIGFPANNFMGQEPGSDEQILLFCQEKYDVQFPLASKISVKGKDQHPLYQFLTKEESNPDFSGDISWNFEKFLVDRSGKVIARFAPRTKPSAEEVVEAIKKALAEDKA